MPRFPEFSASSGQRSFAACQWRRPRRPCAAHPRPHASQGLVPLRRLSLLSLLLLVLSQHVVADLPAHCLLQDVAGDWDFHIGPAVDTAGVGAAGARPALPACGHHVPNTVLSMLALNQSQEVLEPRASVLRVRLMEEVKESPERHLRAVLGADGEEASWTMVFDEGFEIRSGSKRSFFAHFRFDAAEDALREPRNGDRWSNIARYIGRRQNQMRLAPKGDLYACDCGRTSVGWWHERDATGALRSGCFWAAKVQPLESTAADGKPSLLRLVRQRRGGAIGGARTTSQALGAAAVKQHMTAPPLLSLSDVSGGRAEREKEVFYLWPEGTSDSAVASAVAQTEGKTSSASLLHRQAATSKSAAAAGSGLPKSFDWREPLRDMWSDGSDGLSEVFDQGNCGSCYAFSGALVLQMRFRIALLQQHGILYPLELSWKSATRCSPYTEGCEGGFAYLVFKHASEVGLPTADCDRQERPEDLGHSCDWACYRNSTMRFFAKDYGQVGGFSHGASEEGIMREIHERGPVIISFATSAAPEFIYNNGHSTRNETDVMTVFHNSKVPEEAFSRNPDVLPWRYTTHSILAVGWGEEQTAAGEVVKYWLVRNSWGQNWGERGYAKMRRGQNDAAMETAAPWAEPDMDRLPAGFLDMARARHNAEMQRSRETSSQEPERPKFRGGLPKYCEMRPDSPDCQ